jgi:hypothetical protein
MTGHTELDLETLTDAELNILFAVEVCGWKRNDSHTWPLMDAEEYPRVCTPYYCDAPSYVLKSLEAYSWSCDAETVGTQRQVTVMVLHGEHSVAQGTAPTFARAAVIALLAAKRAPQNL